MTFNFRNNLEEIKWNHFAKYLKLLITSKAAGSAKPGPAQQADARARSGFGLGPGLRPLLRNQLFFSHSI